MNRLPLLCRALLFFMLVSVNAQEQEIAGRPSIVLNSQNAHLVVDLAGGAIRDFSFNGGVNPLSWNTPGPKDTSIHGFGHFLCLDRWGPPSDAEGKLGMPYHGEASNVRWTLEHSSPTQAVMSARLAMAGLAVRREIRLSEGAFAVREEVTNEKPLGRIFNIVQHPTIAPPFLDENTIVDSNGLKASPRAALSRNPKNRRPVGPAL